MKRWLVLGLATLVAAPPALAEEATLPAGRRVRVTTPSGRLVGRFVAIEGESLVLAPAKGGGTEPLTLRRSDVLELEVSVRPSRRGKGAMIGALAGLAAAVVIGVAGGEDCPSSGPNTWDNFSRNLNSSLCLTHTQAGLLSGVLAVPAGALLGAAIAPGERWRPVGVDRFAVRPTVPRAGGVGLEVAIGF